MLDCNIVLASLGNTHTHTKNRVNSLNNLLFKGRSQDTQQFTLTKELSNFNLKRMAEIVEGCERL